MENIQEVNLQVSTPYDKRSKEVKLKSLNLRKKVLF